MSKGLLKKTNYFYIDESGSILNNSPYFILGCTRTDTPELLRQRISDLLLSFEDEAYYAFMINQIKEQGFHAVDNHPDVRARFFAMLPQLNFRSFFCLLNKSKSPIKEYLQRKEEKELYQLALDKLLKGRLNNRQDKNVFFFEELQFQQTGQRQILDSYFAPYLADGDIEYHIVGKEKVNLATTDYMNYIFHSLLPAKDLLKVQRMVDNLELVKPKIGLINILHSDTFLTRQDPYDAHKIVDLCNG